MRVIVLDDQFLLQEKQIRMHTSSCITVFVVVMFVAQMPALASDPSGDRDERSKPLNAIPGLRERIQKSEVYQKLKETLPHGKINDRTYYFAEGDLRLDDDQLILYAVNRQEQNEKFEQAKKGLLACSPFLGPVIMGVTWSFIQ